MLGLETIVSTLKKGGVKCSLVGGYAVVLHGAVRGTVGIDIVIEHTLDQFESCEKALRSLGLVPRLPVTASEVFKFREEYIERRNLIAWSFIDPKQTMTVIDIIITDDLRKMKSVTKKFGAYTLPVIALEDLVAMKKKSGRPQDLEDIKMLLRLKNGK
jgi:hypothetical protein